MRKWHICGLNLALREMFVVESAMNLLCTMLHATQEGESSQACVPMQMYMLFTVVRAIRADHQQPAEPGEQALLS